MVLLLKSSVERSLYEQSTKYRLVVPSRFKEVKSLYEHTKSANDVQSSTPNVFILLSLQIRDVRDGNLDKSIFDISLSSIFKLDRLTVPNRFKLVYLL